MAFVNNKYINPFYNQVELFVQNELATRAKWYGAPIRSKLGTTINEEAEILDWSYKKTAWATVTGQSGTVLGGQTSPLMSNAKGNLTLYEPSRNLPRFPLLQSLNITNEGTMGSLIKGTFVFTMWPKINALGFQIDNIEKEFFNPGKEVDVRWGWSVRANDANTGRFRGIIYNFSWNVNPDLSITATISIVSAATIAIGVSGEQTNPQKADPPVKDPLDNPIPDGDLAGIIQVDITELSKQASKSSNNGDVAIYSGTTLPSEKAQYGLKYVSIAMPKSTAEAPSTSAPATGQQQQQNTPQPVTEPIYYLSFGSLVNLMNGLLKKAPQAILDKLFEIQCDGNFTQHLPEVVSTAPERVYFPDPQMGVYGQFKPQFGEDIVLTGGITNGPGKGVGTCINIGRILISTSTIIEVYKKFVKDNQTGLEYKNITKFFEELIKEVNYASGETYQLSVSLIDPAKGIGKAIMSIEDTNLSPTIIAAVKPYPFTATIAKPIMKSVNISSKPPAASAAAAYTEARGGGPQQIDVKQDKIDPKNNKGVLESLASKEELKKSKESFLTKGAGEAFTNEMKGNLSNYKRSATDGHWLTKILYPIELSITIDGIDGFKFGDILKTNLIPQRYNEPGVGMVFMITKISHSIKDGIWETTIDTKSRIEASNG